MRPFGPSRQGTAKAAYPAQVRVDQGGYLPTEKKVATLMTARPVGPVTFQVVDSGGHVVRHGIEGSKIGWNRHYRAVYHLNFSSLHKPGRYRIVVRSAVGATSPWFRITNADHVYGTLVRDGVRFDQVQRDGADVIKGTLDRKPSHLNDRSATVYDWPTMARGSDLITDHDLTAIGGPVDVEGGWFDAGDYLKFTHSTAYNDDLLFLSARLLGNKAPKTLLPEARHGLAWLGKMWDETNGILYFQVGVGSGNRDGTFRGDHDGWRLPQADDHDTKHIDRYVSHRPVFRANDAGEQISPNLVGRVSAAFALAAQTDAAGNPARAQRELDRATSLFALADTTNPPRPLVTALPHAFYPESSWRDDMELGATEIALARLALGQSADPYVADAAAFAKGYINKEAGDTLNLYDTSAIAHADLVSAIRETGEFGLAVRPSDLIGDLRRQLDDGVIQARNDPFGASRSYDEFDVNSHTFGLVATVGLLNQVTQTTRYQDFATQQRGWLLGDNAWGVSAMVGVGSTFPDCMQHQIANLKGTIDGKRPLDVGAVVNGPNNAGIFRGGLGGYQTGMVHCPPGGASPYAAFDGRHSRYVDDVRSWQTDEPALDMTGAAIIAGAANLAH